MPKKEYRVNIKGSYQGHYVLADSPKEAHDIVRKNLPYAKGEPLQVHLWKTEQKGHSYPNKLTPYAKKKMKLVS
jgi:hypothetical protein